VNIVVRNIRERHQGYYDQNIIFAVGDVPGMGKQNYRNGEENIIYGMTGDFQPNS